MMRLVAIAVLAVYGFATAQEQRERSVEDAVREPTMTLIPANTQTLAAVTAKIELPKGGHSGDVPSALGARGVDEASAARENGRAAGEAASAAARDNRENASRASRPVEDQGRQPAAEPSERR